MIDAGPTEWAPERDGRSRTEWLDRLLGSDPGFNRFLIAFEAVCALAPAWAAGWLFVQVTHAMQIDTHGARLPAAHSATVGAANHGMLIIGELVAAVVAMLRSFGIMGPRLRGQVISLLFVPLPLVACMALGLAVGHHRVPSLIVLVLVLVVGTYFRRWGPRGFLAGP